MNENPFQEMMDKMQGILDRAEAALDTMLIQQNNFAARTLTPSEKRLLDKLMKREEETA